MSMPLARRIRAALFHVRAVFVLVAMAIGITLWMLFGVLGAAISALFEKRARPRPPEAELDPRVWSLPAWLR